MNTYHGWIDEDAIDHIAKVLEIVDLFRVPDEGEGKIAVWEELVEKFFCKFYPDSYDGEDEMLDEGHNWGIDLLEFLSRVNSSFNKHMKIDGRTKKSDTRKEEEQSQANRKYSNTSSTTDEKPNKRMCKAEKFEAIHHSLGPNEEYIAIRSYEYDIWERNEDNLSISTKIFLRKRTKDGRYQDRNAPAFPIFYAGPREINIDEYWWKIFKSGNLEVLES
ncbi:hypothetical protein Tco_0691125 [Tanacetum coccineum]